MIKQPGIIRKLTRDLNARVEAHRERLLGRIADEDDFTSRLLDWIEMEFDEWRHAGIKLRVRKLTSKGPGTEEREFGADFVATVSIRLREYQANKGILVQAKCLPVHGKFDKGNWRNLTEQIERMHAHTNEAYVWIYPRSGMSGVRSIRAATLSGVRSRSPDDLYLTKCGTFLGELVQCKYGDPRISGTDRDTLRRLREKYSAKFAIGFSVQHDDEDG